MATNNTILQEMKDILANVKAEYQRVIGDDNISKNTRHTKSYNLRKEMKRLTVIVGLLGVTSEEKLAALRKDKNFAEALGSILNPEDGGTRVTVTEGDNAMQLMFTTYKDVRDIKVKLDNAAEKAGLKLDMTTGVFVKK